jgi:tRNA(His) 5'-end guanylyltransferase
MYWTSVDLLKEYIPTSIYTASDEITMIFSPKEKESNPQSMIAYGGRILKSSTLMAAYTSVRFNHHLRRQITPETNKEIAEKMDEGMAHFDARITCLPREVLWVFFSIQRTYYFRKISCGE